MNDEVIKRFQEWLKPKGIRYFQLLKFLKGTVYPLFTFKKGKYVHPVHFREGMQIRNWMRSQLEFKDYDDHDYDNRWMELVEKAIERKETPESKKEFFDFLNKYLIEPKKMF